MHCIALFCVVLHFFVFYFIEIGRIIRVKFACYVESSGGKSDHMELPPTTLKLFAVSLCDFVCLGLLFGK